MVGLFVLSLYSGQLLDSWWSVLKKYKEYQWIFKYVSNYSRFSWKKKCKYAIYCLVFFRIFSQLALLLLHFLFSFFLFLKERTQILLTLRKKKTPPPLAISYSCLAAKVKFSSMEIMWGFSLLPKAVTVFS